MRNPTAAAILRLNSAQPCHNVARRRKAGGNALVRETVLSDVQVAPNLAQDSTEFQMVLFRLALNDSSTIGAL